MILFYKFLLYFTLDFFASFKMENSLSAQCADVAIDMDVEGGSI